jgi:NAD-dependent deacetylase
MSKPKLVVFSGAGVSRESGLHTYRDEDGIWQQHNPMEVASAQALAQNPASIFYPAHSREQSISR